MKYSAFVIVCIIIHAVVNLDVFRKKSKNAIPALRPFRVFVGSVGVFFLVDLLWGIFEENKLSMALYVDTVFYFIIMGFTILAWTRYVVDYLENKGIFRKVILYIGNLFFLAEIILLIINFFTPILFRVDLETCTYQGYKARNIMLYVQILFYFALFVFTLIPTILSKDKWRRRNLTVALYSVIMGSVITVQIYYPLVPLYSIGCLIGSVMLNSFVINDIKEEYKAALEQTEAEVERRDMELSETRVIAYTDPLTNVRNKYAYVEEEERIDKLIAKGEMGDFAVAVFDLNGLKMINDTKGHDAGDVYIVESCRTIERFFGKESLYRFGGDEFVVILEGENFANRSKLINDFERYIDSCLGTDKPIISSGISRYRKESDNTYHAVFDRADKLMYARKDVLKEHHND